MGLCSEGGAQPLPGFGLTKVGFGQTPVPPAVFDAARPDDLVQRRAQPVPIHDHPAPPHQLLLVASVVAQIRGL